MVVESHLVGDEGLHAAELGTLLGSADSAGERPELAFSRGVVQVVMKGLRANLAISSEE